MFFNIHNALRWERTIALMLKHQVYKVYTNTSVHINNSKYVNIVDLKPFEIVIIDCNYSRGLRNVGNTQEIMS